MRVYTAKPRTNGDGYSDWCINPIPQNCSTLSMVLLRFVISLSCYHGNWLNNSGWDVYPANLPLVMIWFLYHAIGARSVEDQEISRFRHQVLMFRTGMKIRLRCNLNVMFNGIYAAQNKQQNLFITALKLILTEIHWRITRFFSWSKWMNTAKMNRIIIMMICWKAIDLLWRNGLRKSILLLLDTNHDNFREKLSWTNCIVRQTLINRDWNDKINKYVRGFMIDLTSRRCNVKTHQKYLVTATDPCLGWENRTTCPWNYANTKSWFVWRIAILIIE